LADTLSNYSGKHETDILLFVRLHFCLPLILSVWRTNMEQLLLFLITGYGDTHDSICYKRVGKKE
jgi:hypothetical protein